MAQHRRWGGRLAALTLLLLGRPLPAGARPNIVFIMADDMGIGDAGCYGGRWIRTPAIDRLAREGMRFTQCYAGSTVCAPSRSVLMTSLHTGHTRVRGNFGQGGVVGLGGGRGRVPLRAEDLTVAEVLRAAGYATGMTGKWGLGEPNTPGLPRAQGFDRWFGFLNQRRAHDHYPDYLWLDETRFDLPGNLAGGRAQYAHDLFTSFALHFIRVHAAGPFFLYVPYTLPHAGFQVPDLGAYAQRDWPEQARAYAAMVTRMDQHIGRLLDLLEELGLAERTLVFFCSDNGAADRYDGLFDSAGPWRGRKRDLTEGGLRVPMIARWPGRIPAGVTRDTVWSFADVGPTLAELAGGSWPGPTDGVSVLPTLLGGSQDLSERTLYWEFCEPLFQQAGRWRDWKAIRARADGPIALYDLAQDPGETRDRAAQRPEVVTHFRETFQRAHVESTDFPSRR